MTKLRAESMRSFYACPPRLSTPRLLLRAVNMGDVEGFFEMCRDSRTVQFVSLETLTTIEEAKDLIESFCELRKNEELISFGITLKGTGEFVGIITVAHVDTNAEIGFILSRAHWGHGYVSEAAKALVAFGFNKLRLERVYARCRVDNTQSSRAIEKAGLRFRRIQAQKMHIKGAMRDLRLYSITRRENEQ